MGKTRDGCNLRCAVNFNAINARDRTPSVNSPILRPTSRSKMAKSQPATTASRYVATFFIFSSRSLELWLNYVLKRSQTTFPREKKNISFVFKELFPLGPSRDKLGNKGEDLTLLKQQRGGSAVGGQYLRSNLEAVWGLWMSYLRGLYGFQAIDTHMRQMFRLFFWFPFCIMTSVRVKLAMIIFKLASIVRFSLSKENKKEIGGLRLLFWFIFLIFLTNRDKHAHEAQQYCL